jgi:hypothetical protein
MRSKKLRPTKAPSPRILRVGIVLGDRILEERLLRERETVTLGQSVKNDFCLPIEGLPKTLPIFTLEKGRYSLRFTGNMTGRLSSDKGVQTLAQLKAAGTTKRDRDYLVPLDAGSRGKVSIGPMTLLFQFVDAPAPSPAPSLPLSVQRSLVSRIEPKLALILACSLLVHFTVALYAYTRDQILHKPAERVAHSFQVGQYLPPEPTTPEPEVPAEAETAAGASATNAETSQAIRQPKERTRRVPERAVDTKANTADTEVGVEETVAKTALVSVLSGGASDKGLFQAMNNTDQGASLDKSLEHIKDAATATLGVDNESRQRKHEKFKIGTGHDTEVEGPRPATAITPKDEESIPTFDPVEELSISDLDPSSIIKRIRSRYLSGIKRCHQRVLKHDARAQGRVAIRMTVGPTGRVTKAKARGFNAEVDTCIAGQASKWRFQAPTDEGERTSAEFEIPLILKPGG